MIRARRVAARSSGVLDEIVAHKRTEVAARRAELPLAGVRRAAESAPSSRAFAKTLATRNPAVIAEIKRASPSEGVIRADFDPVAIAKSYERSGAACLSVLTDERYFMGHDVHLAQARHAVELPVLRKDFIVDPYQVYESRARGADCLLLIVAALHNALLADLACLGREIGLDVLIEVHNDEELEAALDLDPVLVGINNRDLATFATSLDTTINLLGTIPDDITVVAESGIHTSADVQRLRDAGVHAFLVGNAFMRQRDPGQALRRLFG